ncbi:MAG: DNA-protecting protein DprA [Chitinophagaceae bacterium]|nr:MAG: DNA-protecting protein DprA [Chitinophagaceae bacterium]
MHPDLLYQIALTMIPSIGPVQARILLEHLEPAAIFRSEKVLLEKIDGIGSFRAGQISGFRDFPLAEKECSFVERYGITPLFIGAAGYPRRLMNCNDAPPLLYYKGSANLDQERIIAVIGTRSSTVYGKQVTENLISGLRAQGIMVVSGLAFGIDSIAHRCSIKHGLATVGVLGHGLDQVYPPENKSLAKDMLENGGGLLTEFMSNTRPDRYNFPLRNRIVAGLSDAVIVCETHSRGGSLITAELANGYNREVFAFPGRVNDPGSTGCNRLIRQNKAVLLESATALLELMNWESRDTESKGMEGKTADLEKNEQQLFDILKNRETCSLDELYRETSLETSLVAGAILGLELKNLLLSLPGKLYRLNHG